MIFMKGEDVLNKKAKLALTVGVAGVAAWATSKAFIKPKKRQPKKIFEKNHPFLTIQNKYLEPFSDQHSMFIRLQLTKDEQLVAISMHTDPHLRISDMTWEELKNVYFQNEDVVLLQTLTTRYPDVTFFALIQDDPNAYEGSLIPSKLWNFLAENELTDRFIIASRHEEQIDRFNLYAQHAVALAASENDMLKAFATYTSAFGHFYKPTVDVFCLPEKIGFLPIISSGFINFLHDLNIRVFYDATSSSNELLEKRLGLNFDGFLLKDHNQKELVEQYIEQKSSTNNEKEM